MTRRVRRASATAVVVAVWTSLGLVGTPATRADAPAATGWWWRPQTALTPVRLPSPPTVPPGGLYVAGDPTGPQAFAALRVEVPSGRTATAVTLRVASSSGTPSVGACPAAAAWTPAEAGPWDDRPTFDCVAGSVAGTLVADGATMTFPLAPLVRGAVLDVVLVPGADASGANAVFSVAFERPGDESVSMVAAPVPAPPGPQPVGATVTPGVPAAESPATAPVFVPAADVPAATPTSTSDAAAGVALPRPESANRAVTPTAESSRLRDSAVLRFLAAVVGAALLSVWARAPGRRPMVEDAERGLGRFRRVREGPVPRL